MGKTRERLKHNTITTYTYNPTVEKMWKTRERLKHDDRRNTTHVVRHVEKMWKTRERLKLDDDGAFLQHILAWKRCGRRESD